MPAKSPSAPASGAGPQTGMPRSRAAKAASAANAPARMNAVPHPPATNPNSAASTPATTAAAPGTQACKSPRSPKNASARARVVALGESLARLGQLGHLGAVSHPLGVGDVLALGRLGEELRRDRRVVGGPRNGVARRGGGLGVLGHGGGKLPERLRRSKA